MFLQQPASLWVCEGEGHTFGQQHVQSGEHAVERAHVGAVAQRIIHRRGGGRRTKSVRAHDHTCAAGERNLKGRPRLPSRLFWA